MKNRMMLDDRSSIENHWGFDVDQSIDHIAIGFIIFAVFATYLDDSSLFTSLA
jgi:hypothetical protein